MTIEVTGQQFAWNARYPGPDGKFVRTRPDRVDDSMGNYIGLERLKQDIPKDDLIRILYWVAVHPLGGEDKAANQLQSLGLGDAPADMETVRERVTLYRLKLLGRLTGKITSK